MNIATVKRVVKRITTALVLIGLTAYTLYHLFHAYSADVDMAIVQYMSIGESASFDRAYVFRREEVLRTDAVGEVSYLVGNGEKVSVGTPLLHVYEMPYEYGVDIRSEREALQREIEILQGSRIQNPTASDIEGTASSIADSYRRIVEYVSDGRIDQALSWADTLRIGMNRMEAYAGQTVDYAAKIGELEARLAALSTYYQGTHQTLTNERSGYFYYDTDGYEAILDSACLDTLTVDGFYDRIEQVEALYADRPYDPSGVVGKMTYDFTWYLAIPTTAETADRFSDGGLYEVTFFADEDMTLDMRLYDLLTDELSGRSVLIFSCSHLPEGFDFARRQEVRIALGKTVGYGVPSTALEIVDGFTGVYIFDNGVATFRKITVLGQKNGYYLVEIPDSESEDYDEYLALNDCVIVSGRNLYEGKVVGY